MSPGADTRMTALDKEYGIDPDNPRPSSHPKLVSPVALHLSSEQAPTGVVMHSLSGRYLRSEVFANKGINLGPEGSYEQLHQHLDQIMDMSDAKPLKDFGNIRSLGE